MQTYSHAILTAALHQLLTERASLQLDAKAFTAGSVAPDAALGALTAWFVVDRRLKGSDSVWCGDEYNSLYFGDPVWIVGHNLLHAPFVLLTLALIGGLTKAPWGRKLLAFALGGLLHTAVDVVTHHNDGPLLLFPFNWTYRFRSRLSYWDRAYGARWFALAEHLLDALALIYLIRGLLIARTPT